MTSTNKSNTEEQLDLIAMLKSGWDQRMTVLKFVIVFGVLSVAYALVSPKEYTVVTKLVPSSGDGASLSSSGLGGLASLAGINIGGGAGGGGEVPLNLYPDITKSIPFKMDLLNMKINTVKASEPITVRDYKLNYTDKNILSVIRRYTLGLPGIIKHGLGDKPVSVASNTLSGEDEILNFSYKESMMLRALGSQVELQVNEREGIIVLTSKMPEPLMAAQMAERAQTLLQEKVTEFRIKKAKEQLEFTESLFNEKKVDFQAKQSELSRFRDRNQNITSSVARNEQERLESEYDLALSVYNELAKQLETARIKVKENTPSFSILEPVVIPIEPTKPKRKLMVMIGVALGLIFGVGWIIIKQLYREFRVRFKELSSSAD